MGGLGRGTREKVVDSISAIGGASLENEHRGVKEQSQKTTTGRRGKESFFG